MNFDQSESAVSPCVKPCKSFNFCDQIVQKQTQNGIGFCVVDAVLKCHPNREEQDLDEVLRRRELNGSVSRKSDAIAFGGVFLVPPLLDFKVKI